MPDDRDAKRLAGANRLAMKAQAGLLEASLDYLLSRVDLNRVLGASAK